MALGTAGNRGRIVRQRAVPAPLKRVILETGLEVGTATASSCADARIPNLPPGGWLLPTLPGPFQDVRPEVELPEASPSPIRVEDDFLDHASSNSGVTAPPSSMIPPLPRVDSTVPESGTAVVNLLPVYSQLPSERAAAMFYALECGVADDTISGVDPAVHPLVHPFEPTPLPDPLIGFEIACECKALQAALSDMTEKYQRAEQSAEFAKEQMHKSAKASAALDESLRAETSVAATRNEEILTAESTNHVVMSELLIERRSLEELQAESQASSAYMGSCLSTLREELASSQHATIAAEERCKEIWERSENQQTESTLELASAARTDKSHREARRGLGEQILGLEETVERLEFVVRRSKHTLAEESVEVQELSSEYMSSRDAASRLRTERADLATALSEAAAQAAACEEEALWDRQRRIAAEGAKVESEERQSLLLEELSSARSVTLEEAEMVAKERCERDRDLGAYALQLQRGREEIDRLQCEVHLLRLRIAAGISSDGLSNADPFSEVGGNKMDDILQTPLLAPLPDILQRDGLRLPIGHEEKDSIQTEDLPRRQDDLRSHSPRERLEHSAKNFSVEYVIAESPDPFAEIGVTDLCE